MKSKTSNRFLVILRYYIVKLFTNVLRPLEGLPSLEFNRQYDPTML